MSKPQISIAIPTWNRFDMVVRAVSKVINDPRVSEIVIVDDNSDLDVFLQLETWADLYAPKVKLFRNPRNRDCYANKARSLECCSNEFAILLDSDNIIGRDYIDKLYELERFNPEFSVLPTFARPHFDYREFAGQLIAKDNVARFMGNETFRTALNTANFFVHRDTYLEVWDPSVNPHTADSIFMNYRLLEAGKKLLLMGGLEYDHEVHEGSHYKQNHRKTNGFDKEVEAKLRALK